MRSNVDDLSTTGLRGRPPKLPLAVRRTVVLDVATRQFADHGRVEVSVDAIVAESGVRKPAIYELFGSKDDLFRACVEHAVQGLQDNVRLVNAETSDLELSQRTRRRVAAAVEYAERHPDAFRLLVRAPYSWPDDDPDAGRELRDRLVEVMAANYRRESSAAGLPIDQSADVVARVLFAMSDQIITLCLADTGWQRESLIDFLAEFIEAGLAGVRLETWRALEHGPS